MKDWLRANSSIYARLDPAPVPPPAPRCHCGEILDAAHSCPCVTGFVVYNDGRRGHTYCDGTDEHELAPRAAEGT
jgi:hypothetical protein